MAECKECGEGILYTGLSSNDKASGRISAIIVVDTIASDNTKNVILKTDVLDETYINDKLNEVDESKRWNVIKGLEEFLPETTDKALVTASSGQNYGTSGGEIETVKYNVWNVSEKYAQNLESQFCKDRSYFAIDVCGNIKGMDSSDKLSVEPIPMHVSSGSVKFLGASPGVLPQAQISFEVKAYVNPLNRIIIGKNVIDLDLNQVDSMEQVFATITSITTTGFVAELVGDFGYSAQENKIIGAELLDFTLKDATTGLTISITSVIPSLVIGSENVYTFVTDAMSTATDHTIQLLRDGFELQPTTFTTP